MNNIENSNLKSITLNMSDGSHEEITKGLVLPFDIKLDTEGDQTLTIKMVGISGPEFVYIMKVLAMQAIQMGFFKDDTDEDDEEFELK